MKKIIFIFFLLATIWACKDDEEEYVLQPGDFYLNLSQDAVLVWDTLSYAKIGVETNGDFWDVKDDENANWCEATMNDTKDDRSITLRIGQNPDAGPREAVVTVLGEDDITKTITVKQMGTSPSIIFYGTDLDKVSDDSVILSIDIQANMEYEVVIPAEYENWVSWVGVNEEMPTVNYFSISRNPGEPRDGVIVLKGKEDHPDVREEIHFHQLSYDTLYIPGDPSGIGNWDVEIKISGATASSFQSGGDINLSYDGNATTLWHSNWNTANKDFPISLIYELEPGDAALDYIVYVPRSPRANGTLEKADIYYSTQDTPDDFKLFGNYNFDYTTETQILRAAERILSPAKIKWEIHSGHGGFGAIAEVQYMQDAPPTPVLDAVFTDKTFSELNPGVTYEMIAQIEDPFLFGIAKYLLYGDYPVAERVRTYEAYRHPDNVGKELKTSTYSLYDNPTGIYMRTMEDVVIFVGPTNGEKVSLYVASPMSKGLEHTEYALEEGNNNISITQGGLGYIAYFSENASAQPIKIHIASGSVNGIFDVTKNTDSEWTQMLNRTTFEAFDVVGRKMHLLFEVEDWKTITNPTALIQAWDDIVILEQRLMGLEKYLFRMPKNRIFGHVDNDPEASYMYASAYRTGYSKGTIREIVVESNTRGGSVWGPAHEIGHVNQVRPGLKWLGMAEVSNNIYSQYVQTQFGNTSRLLAENRYEAAFNSVIVPQLAHAVSDDPFIKLVPFWQLQLYAEAVGKSDFYPDLFEMLRTSADGTDNGQIQLEFVSNSCLILDANLAEFFKAWGFLRPADVTITEYGVAGKVTVTANQANSMIDFLVDYPAVSSAVMYLTDSNVATFKNKRNIVTGTASRAGQKITMSGWSNVMAYKVYNAGNVVYISPNNSFTVPSEYQASTVDVKAVQWDGTEVDVTF